MPFKGGSSSRDDAQHVSVAGFFKMYFLHVLIPVWVRGGKHELELYYTRVVPQLPMLNAVQLIRNVCSANVHLRLLETKPQVILVETCDSLAF